MRRREFIAGLGGAAAWPLVARAQQPAMPVIGFLNQGTSNPHQMSRIVAFQQGLNDTAFFVGQNVAIEYQWADDHYDRLPTLALEFVRRRVAVIAAALLPAALAAKAATTTIPIVFVSGSDPVEYGLAPSLARPAGNITGISIFSATLGAKRLELLRALVPQADLIAMLVNPNNPNSKTNIQNVLGAAQSIGQRTVIVNAGSEHDLEPAFAQIVEQQANALMVIPDALFNDHIDQIAKLAARYKMPTMGVQRSFPQAGGLLSYGVQDVGGYRQAGSYAGRILRGEKPTDLPILQPTTFELVINLNAAKVLGLTVPVTLQASADEVIE